MMFLPSGKEVKQPKAQQKRSLATMNHNTTGLKVK